MPDEQHDALLDILKVRTAYFRSLYAQGTPQEFVLGFYEMFDEILADHKVKAGPISCKRGCFNCCRQNVDVSPGEVLVIVDFCKQHGIDIPKGYLQEQLKYGALQVARSSVGWCTFLKDGECSIYEVRPAACRAYHVASPPDRCDPVKFPSSHFNVSVVVWTLPEVDLSAFYAVMDKDHKSGRMPQLLLPYSK